MPRKETAALGRHHLLCLFCWISVAVVRHLQAPRRGTRARGHCGHCHEIPGAHPSASRQRRVAGEAGAAQLPIADCARQGAAEPVARGVMHAAA